MDATIGRLTYQVNANSVTVFSLINEDQPIARLWKRQYIGYSIDDIVCQAPIDAMEDAEYETKQVIYNQSKEK